MKKYLDERQEQIINHIGSIAFLAIFTICAVSIIVQMIFFGGDLKSVAGETVAMTGGGIVYILLSVREGVFLKKGSNLTIKDHLLYIIIFSGIFSVIFYFAIRGKGAQEIQAGKYAGMFFGGIMITGFLISLAIGKCTERLLKKQEEKYKDSE